MRSIIKSGIFGVCIGDALGVPVEFKKREDLKKISCYGLFRIDDIEKLCENLSKRIK